MAIHYVNKLVSTITYRVTRWEKATGLMFRFSFIDECYVFSFDHDQKIPIHMLFVFTPIDVIWVNLEGDIVDLKKSVMPCLPAVYHKGRASTLVELPAGTITKHNIKLMDKMVLPS